MLKRIAAAVNKRVEIRFVPGKTPACLKRAPNSATHQRTGTAFAAQFVRTAPPRAADSPRSPARRSCSWIKGGALALTLTPPAQGSNAITGQDLLGRTYPVQFVTDPQATNWQTLGTATTNSSGTFPFIDSSAAPQRFYRTVYP